MMTRRNDPFGTHFGQRLEAKITGIQISLLLHWASVQDRKNLLGNIVRHIGDELKSADEWADNELIVPRVLMFSIFEEQTVDTATYKVKGPFTRSKRTLPVFMMIKRGTSARCLFITVAANAFDNRL